MEQLNKNVFLIKSGGLSDQLAKHVTENIGSHPLWSSRFDALDPDAVIATYLDYLRVGAQILVSNTYQASVEGYMRHLKLTKEESIDLIKKSVRLVRKAKEQYVNELKETGQQPIAEDLPVVMSSVGPYGAYLHDFSEYDGSYADRVTKKELQDWHRPRIDACLAEGIDGLAIETLPCQIEAEALVEMLVKEFPQAHFWISFSCKDEKRLSHGENFAEAVASIWNIVKSHNAINNLIAIGINCTNPRFVTPLLEAANEKFNSSETRPAFVVYSNAGEIYDKTLDQWTGQEKCQPLTTFIPEWIRLGVRIIGGCCRVGPDEIKQIRNLVDEIKKETK